MWVFAILTLMLMFVSSETILVNRGWVPSSHIDPRTRKEGQVRICLCCMCVRVCVCVCVCV